MSAGMRGSIGRLIDRLVDDRDEVDPDEENRSPVWTRLEGGSFQSPRKSVFTRLEGGAAIREITNRVTGNAGFERTPEPSPEMAEMAGPGPKTPSSRSAKKQKERLRRARRQEEKRAGLPVGSLTPRGPSSTKLPLGSVTPRADVAREGQKTPSSRSAHKQRQRARRQEEKRAGLPVGSLTRPVELYHCVCCDAPVPRYQRGFHKAGARHRRAASAIPESFDEDELAKAAAVEILESHVVISDLGATCVLPNGTVDATVTLSVSSPGCVLTNVEHVMSDGHERAARLGRPGYSLAIDPVSPTQVSLKFTAGSTLGVITARVRLDFAVFGETSTAFTMWRQWRVHVNDPDFDRVMAAGLAPTEPYRRPATGVRVDRTVRNKKVEAGPRPKHHQGLKFEGLGTYQIKPTIKAGVMAPQGSEAEKALRKRLAPEGGVTPANHNALFHELLMAEEAAETFELQKYAIVGDKAVMRHTPSREMLRLDVPGLAEKRPSVRIGDKIFAYDKGGCYEGFVHQVEERAVLLKFSNKRMMGWNSPVRFDRIEFKLGRTGIRVTHQGLDAGTGASDVLPHVQSLIFPSRDDKPPERESSRARRSIRLFNDNLNQEQRDAVAMAMHKGAHVAPYVIFGPPGTGKTSTIVEIIKQVVSRGNVRVLVTAPSNAAADHVSSLLLRGGGSIDPSKFLRINAHGRDVNSIPEQVMLCSLWNQSTHGFAAAGVDEFARASVVAMTCAMAAKYACASDEYLDSFDLVVADEAGHATEPETIAAFAKHLKSTGTLVIAGDHKQLGPIIQSPFAQEILGVSMLERLCRSGPHAPDANTGAYDQDFVTMLVRNYRSHPAIIELPSQQFYHGKLIPSADATSVRTLRKWEGLPAAAVENDFPILWDGIVSEDMREASSPSWFNPVEAQRVVRHIQSLQRLPASAGFKLEDVGVIAPYARQRAKIRQALELNGIAGVRVGTTEEYQGDEKRIIIISLTRSCEEHLTHDARHHIGFVSSPQRFNVAVTRAKCLLIVVGNPLLMAKDEHWGSLLKMCVERGGYEGTPLPEDLFEREAEDSAAAEEGAV